MSFCRECGKDIKGDACEYLYCKRVKEFRVFAKSEGLLFFPQPGGERYLEPVSDDHYGMKKSERVKTIDELWDALVKAKGRPDLTVKGEGE